MQRAEKEGLSSTPRAAAGGKKPRLRLHVNSMTARIANQGHVETFRNLAQRRGRNLKQHAPGSIVHTRVINLMLVVNAHVGAGGGGGRNGRRGRRRIGGRSCGWRGRWNRGLPGAPRRRRTLGARNFLNH